jgi:hypothetical protein
MCYILLSDQVEDFGQERGSKNFVDNDMRGRSYTFTYRAACTFLERNRLSSIIRAHRKVLGIGVLAPLGPVAKYYTVTTCTGKLARPVSEP